jgi:hypothetical protein
MKTITRSTTCRDLGLSKAATCDGCVRRGSRSEDNNKSRQYQCKRYFSDKYNNRKIGRQGKTTKQRGYERAWAELAKRGFSCTIPTEPAAEEKEKPQRRFQNNTPKEATVQNENEKAMASLSEIMVKQTRQQIIEAFIEKSCTRDIVMLIDKLISAAGHDEQEVTDLTNILDTPPKCNPSSTAAAVQGLCDLSAEPLNVPDVVVNNSIPTEADDVNVVDDVVQRDVVDAAQILCSTSKPKGNEKFNANNKLRTIHLNNGMDVPSVPALYDVVSLSKISEWEGYEKSIQSINSCLDGKKYAGTALGKKLLAIALGHAPGLANRSAEILVASIIASFCADCGISFTPEQVALSSVKAGYLKQIMENNGVESIFALRELVQDVDLFISCDKGNSRKGINSFVKYIDWWDEKQQKVVLYVLDIDVADGTSKDAADAIDDSLSKIDGPDGSKITLAGQGSDGGGGGVGNSLYVCLKTKERTKVYYLIATCYLHG